MSKLEEFKNFVKDHPSLINQIKTGEMTWQKYYEMYDMYGEKEEIWKPYFEKTTSVKMESTGNWINDFLMMFKNIDLDSLQEGIGNVQKILGVLKNVKETEPAETSYKPRPIYKHFED